MPDVSVPSDAVLDEIPFRALRLFGAISNNLIIRSVLTLRGYTEAIHERGWSLIFKASGFRPGTATQPIQPEAASAMKEVDLWDEPNFRVARAALAETPEQLTFVFDGLEAQKGAASIAAVTIFLDRVDELESSPERKATRKADKAVVEKLAARGIGPEERKRLRDLIAVATSSPSAAELAGDPVKAEKEAARKVEQREAKIELWRLYNEWSEIAKADIKRRDHLIQLGLAKRKDSTKKTKKKGGTEGEGESEGGDK